jgi:hypothetical protein
MAEDEGRGTRNGGTRSSARARRVTNFTIAKYAKLHGLLYHAKLALVVRSYSAALIHDGFDHYALAVDGGGLAAAGRGSLAMCILVL